MQKRFQFAVLTTTVLVACSGCSGGGGEVVSDPQGAVNQDAARQKLKQRMAETRARQEQAAEQQRQAEQKAADDEAARVAEAAKPHYDPTRLKMAAKPRQWSNITIPDININCWMKSTWTDGKMNLRLALLGQKDALRIFTGSWPYLKIILTDAGGNNLHQAVLKSADLRWADSLRNGGAPTMEFEASTECPLEVYETCNQWNLKYMEQLD